MTAQGIIALYLMSTGFMQADFAHMVRGGASESVRIPALVALLKHPTEGWGLIDTGIGAGVAAERSQFPEKIGRWFLPVEIGPEETAAAQIQAIGIQPTDIRWILLTHLHNDHTGGLRDFPNAAIYLDRREWEDRGTRRWQAVRRGQILAHLTGIESQIHPLDLATAPPLAPFAHAADLFNDGTVLALSTPGHTQGHISVLVKGIRRTYLFTGDTAWTEANYRGPTPKGRLVSTLEEWDRSEQQKSLQQLHDYWLDHPDVTALPAHDPHLWPKLPHLPQPLS